MHLNLFNPSSIEKMLRSVGFRILDLSTPGKLDWDLVEQAHFQEGVSLGRFWETFAQVGTEQAKLELQEWISKHKLSSHMRIIAQKPG